MMRINQHFRCIRDIINSWLPFFFFGWELILRPKHPLSSSCLQSCSQVQLRWPAFFLPQLFLSSLLRLTHFAAFKGGKKKGGFRSHSCMERWSLQLSVFAGKTHRSSSAGSTGLPAAFQGEKKKPRVPGQKCRRHTSMRCPALIVLTMSSCLSILLSLQVRCVCEGQVWCTLQDSTRSSSSTKQLCASTAHSLFCPFLLLCRQIETY